MAFASQVIGLGIISCVLQDSCQCDYSVQEHVLPDLTQSNVDMALKKKLECIRLIYKLEFYGLAFSKMLLCIEQ